MKPLLLAPHDDDQALYAAFTCMRERPLVVIITDSYLQPNRGESGCSAQERAAETERANEILGCEVLRLEIRDDLSLYEMEQYIRARFSFLPKAERIYAPALQGGNAHHDLVGRMAVERFGAPDGIYDEDSLLIQYTTYTKTELYTTGGLEIRPTAEELVLKKEALDCYASQIRINLPHFRAVLGKSEWFRCIP